jgi:hypothetical protein
MSCKEVNEISGHAAASMHSGKAGLVAHALHCNDNNSPGPHTDISFSFDFKTQP